MKNSTNTKKILINFASYGLLQIVNILVGFILPRLYLQIYGSEINGVIATINNFISYFSYVEAGLGLTLMYALYKPLAENNYDSINQIVTTTKKTYRKISIIYFTLVVIFAIVFPLLSEKTQLSYLDFSLLIVVIGAYGAFDYLFMSKYRLLLTADQKEYVISIAMSIAQVLRFIFVFLLLRVDNISVVVVKIAPVLTIFIRTILLRIYVKKHYPNVKFNVNSKYDIKKTSNISALLLQMSISLNLTLPAILVSQMVGYKESSVFSVYYMVISTVISFASIFSSGIAPTLGKKIQSHEDVTNLFEEYNFFISNLLSILFICSTILLLPFVQIYSSVVDDINYLNSNYAILFVVFGYIYASRIPYTAAVNSFGLYRENRLHNIINIFLLLSLSVVLTHFYGIEGSLISAIIVSFHRNITLVYEVRKKIKFNFMKISLEFAIPLLIIICIHLIMHFTNINLAIIDGNVIKWVLVAIGTLIVSLFINVLLGFLIDKKSLKSMFVRIKKVVKRN